MHRPARIMDHRQVLIRPTRADRDPVTGLLRKTSDMTLAGHPDPAINNSHQAVLVVVWAVVSARAPRLIGEGRVQATGHNPEGGSTALCGLPQRATRDMIPRVPVAAWAATVTARRLRAPVNLLSPAMVPTHAGGAMVRLAVRADTLVPAVTRRHPRVMDPATVHRLTERRHRDTERSPKRTPQLLRGFLSAAFSFSQLG